MTKRRKIKTVCEECSGTGLYSGVCEKKGEAVICLRCGGSGCLIYWYTPFKSRKPRRGVRSVRPSRGTFLATGVGGIGESMTYAEFAKDKRFKKIPR